MKKFRPKHRTDVEFNKLLSDAVFVFDTSFLLELYRYEDETRKNFFRLLRGLADRIWLPHQVVNEYYAGRHKVLNANGALHRQGKKVINKWGTDGKESIEKIFRDPSTYHLSEEIVDILSQACDNARSLLDTWADSQPNYSANDEIQQELEELFSDHVGQPYPMSKLFEIYQLGELRYRFGIPPGFKDTGKGDYTQFSDLVLWFQIIDYAKEVKKPIIFVLVDGKSDWWLMSKADNKTLGARPELIQEMQDNAGTALYLYKPDQFYLHVSAHLKQEIKQKVVDDLKKIDDENWRAIIRQSLSGNMEIWGKMLFAEATRMVSEVTSRDISPIFDDLSIDDRTLLDDERRLFHNVYSDPHFKNSVHELIASRVSETSFVDRFIQSVESAIDISSIRRSLYSLGDEFEELSLEPQKVQEHILREILKGAIENGAMRQALHDLFKEAIDNEEFRREFMQEWIKYVRRHASST